MQKECRDWLEITTGQIRQGLTLASARTTFNQVLDNWFTVKENKLRGATRQQYSQIIENYIKPELGTIATKDLTPAKIQDFYSSLQNRGVGARTIEIVHTVLHGCLNHAHRLGLVAQNWAILVEVPRPVKKEMQIWNETQVSMFLAGVPDPAFWRLAFATGMRRGELLG